MEAAVYLLCCATAMACSGLLLRGFQRRRVRLLLWCGIFFLALAAENALLLIGLLAQVDLATIRTAVSLAGVCVLLYGLVFEAR